MLFSFSAPQYLFFLLAIPLIFGIHFWSLSNRKKVALKFANFDAIARIQGVDFFSKNVVMLFLTALISFLLILSVSGLNLQVSKEVSSFSFVIAIDSSQSMSAKDFSPTRIGAAKETASLFVDSVPYGTQMGVISFSGSSLIELTSRQEKGEIKSAIESIELSTYGGTDLYEAIITSSNLLHAEENKAVIILSDGQINVGTVDDAVLYANENEILIHTIAMGTVEGGETDTAFSTLDEQSLKTLSYNTGGTYFNVESTLDLSDSFKDILKVTTKKVSIPLQNYLLVVAIVLFMISFFLGNTRYLNLP